MHGDLRLLRDAKVEPAQHPAPAYEIHAPHDEVLGQLRRRLTETGDHRVDDGRDLFVDGLAGLLR